jgi:hypothetical protein
MDSKNARSLLFVIHGDEYMIEIVSDLDLAVKEGDSKERRGP